MTAFSFIAYDKQGVRKAGTIEAISRSDALAKLARQSLIVSKLEQAQSRTIDDRAAAPRSMQPWTAQFIRQLATLAGAEIPIDRALRMIQRQQKKPKLADLVGRLADELAGGQALFAVLGSRSLGVPAAAQAIIRAGELAGDHVAGLERAADYLERDLGIRAKVRSALLYPAFLLVTALGAIGVICVFLVPALMPLFEENGAAPPIALAMLAKLSSFLRDHGILTLATCLGAVVFWWGVRHQRSVRYAIDGAKLAMPLMGQTLTDIDAIAMSRTMAALFSSGVAATEALDVSASVVANSRLQAELKTVAKAVSEGGAISVALRRAKRFDSDLAEFCEIGEATGKLGPMLDHYGDIVEEALNRRIENLSSLLGPIVTLVTGVLVGTVVISIAQSIMSVSDLAIR
jgi:general secretion pathway protein F